jgi:hypothetical protein
MLCSFWVGPDDRRGLVPRIPPADHEASYHAPGMFLVTEADADAIRTIFNQEGELSAAIELPGDHGQREGADMRPDDRGMEAAFDGAVVGKPDAA